LTTTRAGRKGRVIKDDPRKYPTKEDLGIFSGATGGWAGGEAGLWKLREEVLEQKKQQKAGGGAAPAAGAGKPAVPKPQGEKQPIYIGYSKRCAGWLWLSLFSGSVATALVLGVLC